MLRSLPALSLALTMALSGTLGAQSQLRMQWHLSLHEGPQNIVYQMRCDAGKQSIHLSIGEVLLEDARIGPFRTALFRRPVLHNVQIHMADVHQLIHLESFFTELEMPMSIKCYNVTVEVGGQRYEAATAMLKVNQIELIHDVTKVDMKNSSSTAIATVAISKDLIIEKY